MLALTERVLTTALADWQECAAHGMSLKSQSMFRYRRWSSLPITTIVREQRPAAANWPGLILEVTEDEIIRDLKNRERSGRGFARLALFAGTRRFRRRLFLDRAAHQLPFSELKIDRAYVINCHTDKINAGLCEVFCELGKRFDLKLVAEGIESIHESHKLQALGCMSGKATSTPSRCRKRN